MLRCGAFDFRVKKLTKMSEKVATGVLSGVVKVSGFFASSVVNSKAGKKFFNLLPGEIVLATMDGFSKFNLNISFTFFVLDNDYLIRKQSFISLF